MHFSQTNRFSFFAACLLLMTLSNCRSIDPEPVPSAIALQCRYDQNFTLTNHNPDGVDYIANCLVMVFGGTMTIEPGVTIAFQQNGGIHVGIDGALSAVGTAELPIEFINDGTDHPSWDGITIATESAANQLVHCMILNGGNADRPGGVSLPDDRAALKIGGQVALQSVLINGSEGIGLLASSRSIISEFRGLDIQNCMEYPIKTDFQILKDMDLTTCSFSSNGDARIALYSFEFGSDVLTGVHNWTHAGLPFHVQDGFRVFDDGELTLSAGSIFEFSAGIGLEVKPNTNEPALSADGLPDQPIIFRGVESTAGYWKGIYLYSNHSNNRLNYTYIQDGGSEAWRGDFGANLTLGTIGDPLIKLRLDNCRFENSLACGMYKYDYDSDGSTQIELIEISSTYASNSTDVCE